MSNVIEPGTCYWCGKQCGGTCLKLNASTQMKTNDPAYWMLKDGHSTTKEVHRDGCYICEDPEFSAMGLPLCKPCPQCSAKEGKPAGHIPADDEMCSDCDYSWGLESEEEGREHA